MKKFKTVLCGFGSVAAGIAKDKRMARFIKYQTHAQVLKDHPDFDWQAVVDSDPEARRIAREEWGIQVVVSSPRELQEEFDVAVFATSPEPRISILNELGGIKAVIVEKPLGHTFDDARIFMEYCQKRDILCQVNLFRRTDKTYRE